MKTLSNYIEEKLIINKNYENYVVKPNKTGTCLTLCISTISNERNMIEMSSQEYEYRQNKDVVDGNGGYTYAKNNEGYYYFYVNNWLLLLLFGSDAKDFLNTLLNNPEKYFHEDDFSQYIESCNCEKIDWPLQVKRNAFGMSPKCFDKEVIKEIISEIK